MVSKVMALEELIDGAWFLSGPTASGKSAVGLELAPLLNAEIISLDSMAVYRGMDIGTAKPTPQERHRVPHHLLDLVDPDQEFSIAEYLTAANEAVREITERGKRALFVGGTPLYLKSLLRGIATGPPADWSLRQSLLAAARDEGAEVLHARVAEIDPVAASRLHPNDTRRLVRALEVYQKTGMPLSQWQQQTATNRPSRHDRVFVLEWQTTDLRARIDRRVDAMIATGFVEEVRMLRERFPALSRTASQAVGYQELIAHVDGQFDLPHAIELMKLRTWQFARRQRTWFRSLAECRAVPMDLSMDPATTARQICQAGQPAG